MKIANKLKVFLANNNCDIGKESALKELKDVEDQIVEIEASKNTDTVKEHIETLETLDGNFSQMGMWKLKQKLCPVAVDPPMAKLDDKGNLITSPEALKQLYIETYRNRLSHRIMKPEYNDIFLLKTELWMSRLSTIKTVKTNHWECEKLDAVLKGLKNNKTMDPCGYVNELFKHGCIGSDLKNALSMFFNGTKSNQLIPMFVTLANITTIFKNKGSRMDMNNDRGIFILTVLKKILDKLIYNDNYEDIDKNMSDSNVGARKRRNIKDHLLIVHGVINSVIRGNEPCVDIQIYDLEKAFDALWLEDCLNDVFDNISEQNRNDKISLLYESNKTNMVAVKTAVGMTKRVNMPSIVQQGGTWGSLLCSNSIDTLGKKCRDRGENFHLYKHTARILPLSFVDDILGISKCGFSSISLNTFINTQIELKKLRFHVDNGNGKSKCHKLHIGKSHNLCPTLKVHGTIMPEVKEDTYLGDILSTDGRNTKNIKSRISKGIGIISQLTNILEIVRFGNHYFEVALMLRDSMLVNGTITNAEIWYNMTESETKEFDNLDKMFLRKILEVPCTTPCESYYLELGILPIHVIIKARRINYLHSILSRDKTSMLYSFFITQWNNPTKGDWTEQVKEDLEDFSLPWTFEKIQTKSKEAFKRIVKIKAKEYALKELQKKQENHSKMTNLMYNDLTIQHYLTREDITIQQKKMLFKYRTRMENFGENFRGSNGPVPCPLCGTHLDNQELSFQCQIIKSEVQPTGEMAEIYRDDIKTTTVESLERISKLRSDKLKEK